MARDKLFESARLKMERANQHIADLQAASDAFTGYRHNFGFYMDAQSNEMVVEVRLNEPIPTSLPLLIGDAIHNLRTALDQATWELIGLDGGRQDRSLTFPARRVQRDYEAACSQIETPRADTKKFFIAFETYPGGGGEKLFALHLLDNTDKHRILTPIISASTLQSAKVFNQDDEVVGTLQNITFTMGPDGRARLAKLGPDRRFEFDENIDPTIDIFFGDVEFFEFAPLIPTLAHLSEDVSHALEQFEEFVRMRA
ncbi:MAG: hypothetical protein IIA72_24070 [Proteobacteria bacterium]|nr:hypothetical protein [Pseudomonadota bacterium]